MDDENFFQQIIAEAPDGILYSDAKGIITLWNKGCERIFGFVAAEALGQSLDIIIPDALRQRHWQGYDETIRTGRTRYGAGELLAVPALRKDGGASLLNSPSSRSGTMPISSSAWRRSCAT